MDQYHYARLAYDAYYAAAGGRTMAFDQLSQTQKDAWHASAEVTRTLAGFRANIGDTVKNDLDIEGTVRSMSVNKFGERGYWLECVDTTGRPFEHYVDDREVEYINGEDARK
jgi:hypothetical protein